MANPQAILGFLRDNIKTVWALEHLLLMQRAPTRKWTPAELVVELRASDMVVRANLENFERAGLVAPHEGGLYQFAPATADMAETCAALAGLYQERPYFIRRAIMSAPDRLQELADAFKIRREPE